MAALFAEQRHVAEENFQTSNERLRKEVPKHDRKLLKDIKIEQVKTVKEAEAEATQLESSLKTILQVAKDSKVNRARWEIVIDIACQWFRITYPFVDFIKTVAKEDHMINDPYVLLYSAVVKLAITAKEHVDRAKSIDQALEFLQKDLRRVYVPSAFTEEVGNTQLVNARCAVLEFNAKICHYLALAIRELGRGPVRQYVATIFKGHQHLKESRDMLVYSRRAYRTALEILEFVTALYKTYDLKAVQKGPSEDLDEVVIFASKAYVAISKLDLNESADCYLVCQDHFSLYKETRAKEHLDHAVIAMWRSLNGLPLGEFERKGSPLSLYSESTISKVPDEKQETVETKGSNASTQPADAPQVSLPEKGSPEHSGPESAVADVESISTDPISEGKGDVEPIVVSYPAIAEEKEIPVSPTTSLIPAADSAQLIEPETKQTISSQLPSGKTEPEIEVEDYCDDEISDTYEFISVATKLLGDWLLPGIAIAAAFALIYRLGTATRSR